MSCLKHVGAACSGLAQLFLGALLMAVTFAPRRPQESATSLISTFFPTSRCGVLVFSSASLSRSHLSRVCAPSWTSQPLSAFPFRTTSKNLAPADSTVSRRCKHSSRSLLAGEQYNEAGEIQELLTGLSMSHAFL